MVCKPIKFRLPLRKNIVKVFLDPARDLLSVEHDGTITWDQLQEIKKLAWGDCTAIEIYPPECELVNNVPMRHLWKLGPNDWWPNLAHEGQYTPRTLREKLAASFGEKA